MALIQNTQIEGSVLFMFLKTFTEPLKQKIWRENNFSEQ